MATTVHFHCGETTTATAGQGKTYDWVSIGNGEGTEVVIFADDLSTTKIINALQEMLSNRIARTGARECNECKQRVIPANANYNICEDCESGKREQPAS